MNNESSHGYPHPAPFTVTQRSDSPHHHDDPYPEPLNTVPMNVGVTPTSTAPAEARKQRSCEPCRALKVRCEFDNPPPGPTSSLSPAEQKRYACRRCQRAGRQCVITARAKKQERQRRADNRVAELEKRVNELTASLVARGVTDIPGLNTSSTQPSNPKDTCRSTSPDSDRMLSPPSSGKTAHTTFQSSADQQSHAEMSSLPEKSSNHPLERSNQLAGTKRKSEADDHQPAYPSSTHSSSSPKNHRNPPTALSADKMSPRKTSPSYRDHNSRRSSSPSHGPSCDSRSVNQPLASKPASTSPPTPGEPSSSSSNPLIITLDFRDHIERGLITLEQAESFFERYVKKMMPALPIVVVPPEVTVYDLRKTKPVLFSVIMMIGSSETFETYRTLEHDTMHNLSYRAIVQGEKTVEMVQSLLLATFWHRLPERYEELKFYQTGHLAATMAIDLGLGRPPNAAASPLARKGVSGKNKGAGSLEREKRDANHPGDDNQSSDQVPSSQNDVQHDKNSLTQKQNTEKRQYAAPPPGNIQRPVNDHPKPQHNGNETPRIYPQQNMHRRGPPLRLGGGRPRDQVDSRTVENRRLWLGIYMYATTAARNLHRPILIRWSWFCTESVKYLETSPDALPSDRLLCAMVKLNRLGERIFEDFSMGEGPGKILDQGHADEARLTIAMRGYRHELELLRLEIGPELLKGVVLMTFNALALFISEIALRGDEDERVKSTMGNMDMLRQGGGIVIPKRFRPHHVEALSTCLSVLKSTLDTLIDMPTFDIICLPMYNNLRIANTTMTLFKIHMASTIPDCEVHDLIRDNATNAEDYIEKLHSKYAEIAVSGRSRPAAKFFVVLGILRAFLSGRRTHAQRLAKEDDKKQNTSKSAEPQTIVDKDEVTASPPRMAKKRKESGEAQTKQTTTILQEEGGLEESRTLPSKAKVHNSNGDLCPAPSNPPMGDARFDSQFGQSERVGDYRDVTGSGDVDGGINHVKNRGTVVQAYSSPYSTSHLTTSSSDYGRDANTTPSPGIHTWTRVALDGPGITNAYPQGSIHGPSSQTQSLHDGGISLDVSQQQPQQVDMSTAPQASGNSFSSTPFVQTGPDFAPLPMLLPSNIDLPSLTQSLAFDAYSPYPNIAPQTSSSAPNQAFGPDMPQSDNLMLQEGMYLFPGVGGPDFAMQDLPHQSYPLQQHQPHHRPNS